MTTTKESPDKGASAIGGYMVTGFPPDVAQIINDHWCELFDVVPAQDSGQGEAVAQARIVIKAGKIEHVEYATDLVLPDGTHDVSLHTHPPKPAQDAAGKGVECSHSWHDYGSLGGRNVTWCAKCDALVFTGHDYPSAKPAQVGEKYREFTIDDTKRISRRIRFLNGDPVDKWAVLLQELKAIGAVVPAQDGGV